MSERPDKQMSDEEADRYRIEHAGSTSQERFFTSAELALNQAAIVQKVSPILKRAAAMLAMLADRDPKGRKTIDEFADEINNFRLSIPADYAAALDEHLKASELKGWKDALRNVVGSLKGYPDCGGHIEIMQEIDRIVAERVQQAVREEME